MVISVPAGPLLDRRVLANHLHSMSNTLHRLYSPILCCSDLHLDFSSPISIDLPLSESFWAGASNYENLVLTTNASDYERLAPTMKASD